MISFLLCLAILVGGYFVYGKIVDNTFGPDDRETPAVRINDGVDYVVMPQWKLFLVQLLNIAGLGPIFGAMQGALWGGHLSASCTGTALRPSVSWHTPTEPCWRK